MATTNITDAIPLTFSSMDLAKVYGKAAICQSKSVSNEELVLNKNEELQVQASQSIQEDATKLAPVLNTLSDLNTALIIGTIITFPVALVGAAISAGLTAGLDAAVEAAVSSIQSSVATILYSAMAVTGCADGGLQVEKGDKESDMTEIQGISSSLSQLQSEAGNQISAILTPYVNEGSMISKILKNTQKAETAFKVKR